MYHNPRKLEREATQLVRGLTACKTRLSAYLGLTCSHAYVYAAAEMTAAAYQPRQVGLLQWPEPCAAASRCTQAASWSSPRAALHGRPVCRCSWPHSRAPRLGNGPRQCACSHRLRCNSAVTRHAGKRSGGLVVVQINNVLGRC